MCINILQNIKAVGGVSRTNHVPFMQLVRKKVQLPVILRIFEEKQNPVDMHTSIMCINILQNIKAVAPKL
jgi:transcriptional regulator of aromatic amino acid metabolism